LILVTNNPKVQNHDSIDCSKKYVEGTYGDVLMTVRDMVHKGHILLSHPLSGSVKPNETPYKSVLMSKSVHKLDLDSLNIIEESMKIHKNLMESSTKYGYNKQEDVLADFMEIDFSLIKSALGSA
jgi:hypothetical protein